MDMKERKKITQILGAALEKHLNPDRDTRIYIAREVTFDYISGHALRVDYMQFKPENTSVSGIEKGDFYCCEVKSCVEDFKSKNGHNFLGDYNYYVMPLSVYEWTVSEIPNGIGVLVASDATEQEIPALKIIKNARRKNRERSASEMLFFNVPVSCKG